jgi:hypothetical protein
VRFWVPTFLKSANDYIQGAYLYKLISDAGPEGKKRLMHSFPFILALERDRRQSMTSSFLFVLAARDGQNADSVRWDSGNQAFYLIDKKFILSIRDGVAAVGVKCKKGSEKDEKQY